VTPPLGTATAASQPSAELQDALLSITVNGASAGEPVAVLRGAGGQFFVPSPIVATWRLKSAPAPAFSRDGIPYCLLNGIDGLGFEFAEATQALAVTTRPDALGWTRLSYADVAPTDEVTGGTGGFLNYDASAQLADGAASLAGAIEAGIFTQWGVGISAFVGRWSNRAAELVRLDSNWTIDDPVNMRSLRFGDSVSRGGVGGVPLRFGGIQLARNFAVQPGFVTIPLPALRGSAALPSVVDLYVNDALHGSRDLPAGPFELSNVPIVTGAGDVQLVVRDLLGREMLYSQSYYAAPDILRKGLRDYSFEAGFLRRSFGLRSNDYGALMMSATLRQGISDRVTGEVHAEATRHIQAAGIAAAIALPRIGQLQASLAASRSREGSGGLAGFKFDRRTRGLSFGLSAELTSKDYMALGWDRDRRPPASVIQAFAGLPLGFGSFGLSYLRRDGRSEPDAEYVSANSSIRLVRIGSLHLAARKGLRGEEDFAAELFLVIPIGREASATAGASLAGGRSTFNAAFQRDLPAGEGVGYRVATSAGAINRIDGKLIVQTRFGAYDGQLTWIDGRTGVRLSASGGFGMVGGDVFASRQLSQSFATVRVGGYANVRVYADNQLIGRTNRNGLVVVPRLRPFDRNRLRIELADLPWDAEVTGDELTVRPYGRHGVAVEFAAGPARAAIVTIVLDDGEMLPAGSMIRLNGGAGDFVSAPGGDVYLTGLEADNSATASWSSGSCRARFRFAATAEPQPRLGVVQCQRLVQ
jgi:outer membrane usher protein